MDRYVKQFGKPSPIVKEFLQMPLVSIRVGNPIKGIFFTILLEHTMGVNYHKMGCIINNIAIAKCSPQNAERMERVASKCCYALPSLTGNETALNIILNLCYQSLHSLWFPKYE